jgi:hypothetical protein
VAHVPKIAADNTPARFVRGMLPPKLGLTARMESEESGTEPESAPVAGRLLGWQHKSIEILKPPGRTCFSLNKPRLIETEPIPSVPD